MAHRLVPVLLLLLLAGPAARADDPAPRDRYAFAEQIAKVRIGMTRAEVDAILGRPSDSERVKIGKWDHSVMLVRLKYGSGGRFASRGTVVMERDGRVLQVFGAAPCQLEKSAFEEHEIDALLALIDSAPSYDEGHAFDPVAFVRIVNALQPLGKERALAAIREFVRVAPDTSRRAYEGLYLVLRALFDVPADPGFHPHMYVGAPTPIEPREQSIFPRFPLAIRDGAPFLIVSGYVLAGRAERLEAHLAQFEQTGVMRSAPMKPGAPEAAGRMLLDDLAQATYDPRHASPGDRFTREMLVYSQVRRAKNLGPIDWHALAGTTTSDWGEPARGLVLRATAPRAIEAGLALSVSVDLSAQTDALPESVTSLNCFLHPAHLTLEMEHVGDADARETIRPYDPTAGMPALDDGQDGARLADGPITLEVSFPLVTRPALVPGRYRCVVEWSQPGESQWMDAAAWAARGFWKGTVRSAPFEIEVCYAFPSKLRMLVPTRLRLTDELTVVTDPEQVYERIVPSRNGYFIGVEWSVDGEMFMLTGSAHDPLNPTIDDLKQRKPKGPRVTYAVEVFETSDPPMHMWMPGEGSGGYKVLFRREFVIAPTPEQLKRLGPGR